MYGVTVDVEVYEPEPQCTVIVSDLPELDHKEMELLEMYFENPRSGGDTVTNIKLDEEERLAYVTFESEEGIQFLLTDERCCRI